MASPIKNYTPWATWLKLGLMTAALISGCTMVLPPSELYQQVLDPYKTNTLNDVDIAMHQAFANHRQRKENNEPVILLLGNSAVQGDTQQPHTTLAANLEAILRQQVPTIHVENLGLAGSKAYSLFYVFQHAISLHPNALFIGITPRDFLLLPANPNNPDRMSQDSNEHGAFYQHIYELNDSIGHTFPNTPHYQAALQTTQPSFLRLPTNSHRIIAQWVKSMVANLNEKYLTKQETRQQPSHTQAIINSIGRRMAAKEFNPSQQQCEFWQRFYPLKHNPSFQVLDKLMALAQAEDIPITVFIQPQPADLINTFYGSPHCYSQPFIDKIQQIVSSHGGSLLNSFRSLSNVDLFDDYLHLTPKGHHQLAKQLANHWEANHAH